MNKQCFQVIFSKSQQQFVVVSELAKSAGKSSTVPKAKVDDLFSLLFENLFREVTHSASELNAGNIKLTTTEGNLDVIGSHLNADKIALSSAKDINLESTQDSYQNRSDNSNSGWSVGVFLGMSGNSMGLGVEGSAQFGKGKSNTDTITQSNTYLNAKEVSIESQNDTNLKGAVVNADALNAEIGGNLTIESRQDTNQYHSEQTQAGVSASVAIYGSGSSASASYSQNKAKANSAQVEEQSGFNVGNGGMNVTVVGNTHLKGGRIASEAETENNYFRTGTLTTENIHNHSEMEIKNTSAGVSTNMAQMGMQAVGTALSALGNVDKNTSSTTHSAIGNNIQLEVKDGNVPTELSRDVANSNEKVTAYTQSDIAKHTENQEIANLAGQVGARFVGDLSQHFDWKDGSPQKVILHGVVGLISAELSGGNNVAGAVAGVTSEYLNSKVADYLSEKVQKGELTSEERNAIQQATAAGMGAMVGSLIGGNRQTAAQAGTSALNAEKFNRQLHPDEKQRIKELAQGDLEKEKRLTAAACALVRCSAHIPNDDPDYAEVYAKVKALEELGNQTEYANERALLSKQVAHYDMLDSFSGNRRKLFEYNEITDAGIDKLTQADTKYGVRTRVVGTVQAAGGAAIAAGSTTGAMGACAGTGGIGCAVAVPVGAAGAAYGADLATSGVKAVATGKYHSPIGARALAELTGIPPTTADVIYSAPSLVFGASPTLSVVNKAGQVVAKEASQAATATKYAAKELGKDVNAAKAYVSDKTTQIGVNYQNNQVLTNINNAIPKEYKVAFSIEVATGAMVESLHYLDGSKELNLPNVVGSGKKVGFEASYNALTHKLNPVYGVMVDTAKGVVADGKDLNNSVADASLSGSISSISARTTGSLNLGERVDKTISSLSIKTLEHLKNSDENKANKEGGR